MSAVLLESEGIPERVVKIFKPMTTIGADDDNDIQVTGAGLEATHAQISRSGETFSIIGMTRDMTINGRRERSKKLTDGDVVRFGQLKLTFFAHAEDAPSVRPEPRPSDPGNPVAAPNEILDAYRRVHEFSTKLMDNASTEALVETILDAIVELSGADKGFLVLLDDAGAPEVRAARNVDKTTIGNDVAQLSDSILRKVLETKAPIIVADALRDMEFNASTSVVNLKLLSVMCCPLLDRDQVKGALYVGNNRLTGAFDEHALDAMNVFAAQASLLLSQVQRIEDLDRQRVELKSEIEDMRFGSIVGACDSMKQVFKRIRKVATTDISVLITGETGTGKELIAREVHRNSRRSSGPFVVINCGAIPENLLESELFGHVKGAFTGAVTDRAGRFQAASGGTLFLDEIGEMPLQLQVKLLRALQEHEVTPVGGVQPTKVDIRVLAATNRVLEDEIKAGRFREDVYYRLNVVNIHLPPLRERGEDLEVIARYLLARVAKEQGAKIRGFSKSCLTAIRKYRWPGNVRELENRVKKAVVLAESNLLTAADMDIREEDLEEIMSLAEAKARFQSRYINQALERNGGNRTKTARELDVDARTIFRHLKKLEQQIPNEDGNLGAAADSSDLISPPRP